MGDVTEAGATGRKPRGSGTAATAATPEGGPTVAVAGTAEQVAQAAEQPVVLGGPVPETPGGPGVGAAKVAERVTTTVTRPLDGGAEAALGLRPLSESERAELAMLRERAGADPQRTELLMLRGLVSSGGLVVDAAQVEGRRLAQAATAIKRDGVMYAPDGDRPWVPVDFAAYTELVEIGAITKTPWGELEREAPAAPEAGGPWA